jgi:hypothetical protein
MKRLWLSVLVATPLLAQEPPPAPAQPAASTAPAAATPAQPATPAAQTTTPAPAAATPAAQTTAPTKSPVPSAESWLTGSIDLGYRWQTGVGGSLDTYRSIVNLGSGPKLVGADFTLTDPQHRVFDQIRVRAYGWGDEPYASFHLDARKSKLYDFNADYRDMAYFNYMPSYADPLASRGIVLNEQSFDTRRHLGSYTLDLLPGNWFVPFLAYERDSGSGIGATVFQSDANEYPVPNTIRDLTNLYRGGVRFELRRFHATLEGGGTTFKNDQSLYQSLNPGNGPNPGNNLAPYFGQKLDLSTLAATYGIRGHSEYGKLLATANLTSWLDFYGQFLFSQPDTTVNYYQRDTGNLVLQSQLLFYTGQQYLVSAATQLPHTTGTAGVEIRPVRRLRILESWLTDRLHEAGSASTSNLLLTSPNTSTQIAGLLASSLATNYNQQEVNVIFDATSKLTLRGGYRYVWGDGRDATLPAAGLVSSDQVKLRRNVGLGAITFRPIHKLSLSAEAEAASSSGAYFRTSLYDYQKVRAQARYQATGSLSVSADFTALNNQDPQPGVKYDYLALSESLSLLWSPAKKAWDFEGSYTRSALRSNIGYLDPGTLAPEASNYRDNAHTATALLNIRLPHGSSKLVPRLTAGGSFFISSGSRPTSYYQPLAKLWIPLTARATWFTEWTYDGYGEAFYLYEGFRTHLVTTGVRLTR